MASDTAIADAGESLLKLLQEGMADLVQPNTIALLSPADTEGRNVSLTLFLYYLAENPHMKNRHVDYGGAEVSPLTLDLYYMITAYTSVQDIAQRSLEEQRVLGRAMSILHRNRVLFGSRLLGSLGGADQALRIAMNPLGVAELSSIWQSIPKQHYRPSVSYVVSPVILDAAPHDQPAAVTRTIAGYGKSEGGE